MTKLSVEQIKSILPHREPFLMLDRVEDYEEGDIIAFFRQFEVARKLSDTKA